MLSPNSAKHLSVEGLHVSPLAVGLCEITNDSQSPSLVAMCNSSSLPPSTFPLVNVHGFKAKTQSIKTIKKQLRNLLQRCVVTNHYKELYLSII